jgi:hypothetical protein
MRLRCGVAARFEKTQTRATITSQSTVAVLGIRLRGYASFQEKLRQLVIIWNKKGRR